MWSRKIKSLFNPDNFQGWGKSCNYFEGWYFKFLNHDETRAFAVIPGVAMDQGSNNHSFIQVLDGKKKTAEYHKFDFASFKASRSHFRVTIGNNHFSRDSISLDLPGLKGMLGFSGVIPWPNPWYSPGIMGPYSFAPFMECYHGIVSMDHSVSGSLEYGNELIDFCDGRGYTEKDWGSSFPEGYIWIQSNHFEEPGVSVKISVAKIPWRRSSFVGFLAGIWIKDRLIRFTTYNGSALRTVRADNNKVEIVAENNRYILEIAVDRDSSTPLVSPIRGHMNGKIEESMSSLVRVNLTDRKAGNTLFAGTGRNAAAEVAGRVEEIITG
jgi:tocopherol cyclase